MRNREDVKRALVCCNREIYEEDCEVCPYNGEEACGNKAFADALLHIEQLEARNREIKRELDKKEQEQQPTKKRHSHAIILRTIETSEDAKFFVDNMSEKENNGYTMMNCGINGSDTMVAWALLSKEEEWHAGNTDL